ncbi:vacuolar cation/proton exchanger 3-like [Camellia sinensis]|uniref:vacuolar cation/proton exchanger 3-like n=1 Tax=Camellia sinensis TaxID=4442 RepID=UPI001036E2E7|nr:vacuolar cation/proton exchanger 3-like [Camellia sinensis]
MEDELEENEVLYSCEVPSEVPCGIVRLCLANLQEVILGTKLSVLFPAIPLAVVAECYGFGRVSFSCLALLGFCLKQAYVNSLLLLLALLCHMLPLMFRCARKLEAETAKPTIELSRVSSIVMLVVYFAYLVFQLWTHRQMFEAKEEGEQDDDVTAEEAPVIRFAWLVGMTAVKALLLENVVGTIEDASASWGISVSFISIILLPIVGNAAGHAGAIIFSFKNKLDIALGVALGSATQIAVLVVPLSVIVAWIIGIKMDLDFNLIETGSLALAIIITAFTLQDGTSHYMKGLVRLLSYIVIAACFFVCQTPLNQANLINLGVQKSSTCGIFRVIAR